MSTKLTANALSALGKINKRAGAPPVAKKEQRLEIEPDEQERPPSRDRDVSPVAVVSKVEIDIQLALSRHNLAKTPLPLSQQQLKALVELFTIGPLIAAVVLPVQSPGFVPHSAIIALNALRERLAALQACAVVYDDVLVLALTLDEHDFYGLPAIFENHAESFPSDLQDDARVLYDRFMQGDLDNSLVKGLVYTRRSKANGKSSVIPSLQPKYEFRKSAAVVGHNGLRNGQWWLNRLALMRDGAHGASEAGIYGVAGLGGAVSIVVSGDEYSNQDNGKELIYYGTIKRTDGGGNHSVSAFTLNTQLMRQAFASKQPIRVIRGPTAASVAPACGLRYDGLYCIVDAVLEDARCGKMRFRLRREPGQSRLRYGAVARRPNAWELAEKARVKEVLDEVAKDEE